MTSHRTVPPLYTTSFSGQDLIDFATERGKALSATGIDEDSTMGDLLGDPEKLTDFLYSCYLAWRRQDPSITREEVFAHPFEDLVAHVNPEDDKAGKDEIGENASPVSSSSTLPTLPSGGDSG